VKFTIAKENARFEDNKMATQCGTKKASRTRKWKCKEG